MSAELEELCGIVAGAASGIGRAVTQLLAAGGATVLAGDINSAALRDEASANVHVCALDVATPESWRDVLAAAQQAGGVDFLVNCAGVSVPNDNIDRCGPDEWRHVMRVNLDGAFLGTKAVVETMRASGHEGSIVNICSVLGIVADGGTLAYGASKGALRGLTKSVALAAAPHRIRCNLILPGYIRTPMTERWLVEADVSLDELAALHPLQRLGEPDEVARLARFLVGPDSAFVTGAELAVDGGYLAV